MYSCNSKPLHIRPEREEDSVLDPTGHPLTLFRPQGCGLAADPGSIVRSLPCFCFHAWAAIIHPDGAQVELMSLHTLDDAKRQAGRPLHRELGHLCV
jgi:hypothetical protein